MQTSLSGNEREKLAKGDDKGECLVHLDLRTRWRVCLEPNEWSEKREASNGASEGRMERQETEPSMLIGHGHPF